MFSRYFFFGAKKRDDPKEQSRPANSKNDKPKRLHIVWHNAFGDGMIETVNGRRTYSGQYG